MPLISFNRWDTRSRRRDGTSETKGRRHMGLMEVLDPTGHTRHIWDANNEAEVAAARALYNSLTGQGYRAFHVKGDATEGRRMDEFDPHAEKMILTPQLRGG